MFDSNFSIGFIPNKSSGGGGSSDQRTYYDGDDIAGVIRLDIFHGKHVNHKGIRLELCTNLTGAGKSEETICKSVTLANPGILSKPTDTPFNFRNCQLSSESYESTNFKKSYHLQDMIKGRICFTTISCQFDQVNLQLVKKEDFSKGKVKQLNEEIICNHEIIDGEPTVKTSIPFRLFLCNFNLTPTLVDINDCLSIRYFLRIVVMKESVFECNTDKEIHLYRKAKDGCLEVPKTADDNETDQLDQKDNCSNDPTTSDSLELAVSKTVNEDDTNETNEISTEQQRSKSPSGSLNNFIPSNLPVEEDTVSKYPKTS